MFFDLLKIENRKRDRRENDREKCSERQYI
jgi:hypothetical protein